MGMFSPDDADWYVPSSPLPKSVGKGFAVVNFSEDRGECLLLITVYVDKSVRVAFVGNVFNKKYPLDLEWRLKDEVSSICNSFYKTMKEEISPESVTQFIVVELKKVFKNKERFKGCDVDIPQNVEE